MITTKPNFQLNLIRFVFLQYVIFTGFTVFSQGNVIHVTNTNDIVNGDTTSIPNLIASNGGDGISLREAMLACNYTLNVDEDTPDEIHFNISGTGPFTIQPLIALPKITDPIVIDGYTQPGASPAVYPSSAIMKIEIDGQLSTQASGLVITAGKSTVKGITINRFNSELNGYSCISLEQNGGNHITGNYIGTDVTGSIALSNSIQFVNKARLPGISVESSNNFIGGTEFSDRNLISGNGWSGIHIAYTTDSNIIKGNYIGVDITGSYELPNGWFFVYTHYK